MTRPGSHSVETPSSIGRRIGVSCECEARRPMALNLGRDHPETMEQLVATRSGSSVPLLARLRRGPSGRTLEAGVCWQSLVRYELNGAVAFGDDQDAWPLNTWAASAEPTRGSRTDAPASLARSSDSEFPHRVLRKVVRSRAGPC
jgi:hypothetical protein